MTNVNDTATPIDAPADISPKTKFIVTIGTQILIGLTGIAATAAVTIYVAKMTNDIVTNINES